MKTTIIQTFSEHGTFVQPDTIDYILSKPKPVEFTSFIIKNLKECPLVLTVEHIKKIENTAQQKPIRESETTKEQKPEEIKKLQTKMLSTIYGEGEIKPKNVEDEETEFDDPDKSDQITLQDETEQQETILEPIKLEKIKTWKPFASEYEAEISIIKDITGNSTCEGTTNDFTKLFRNRYNSLRKILRSQRREVANTIPIKHVKKTPIKEIKIIGIVKEIRTTTNGHKLIELEDETDTITCIALKNNSQAYQTASEVVLDEIIGIQGQMSRNGDLLVINSIIYPDISIQNQRHKSEIPLYAAFLSDIHIGSKKFMLEQWNSFLKWINGQLGNSRQRDVAGKIKYLVVPGDVVDGIGIYPNQENELSISDVYRQYETLAEQLRLIPDHITIIIQPGNHDAVRPAEPQPTFEKEIQNLFSDMNIIFVGNPCYFSIHGVEILSYHGQSLLDYATNIQHLKYNEPIEIMKIMLKKHHLAPTYGGYTPLAPEHIDYMIIDKIPDVFVTGHVHLAQIGEYRGVKLINASSWQSQTVYQKMLNFIPDSAKLPILDLKSGNITMMDFSRKI